MFRKQTPINVWQMLTFAIKIYSTFKLQAHTSSLPHNSNSAHNKTESIRAYFKNPQFSSRIIKNVPTSPNMINFRVRNKNKKWRQGTESEAHNTREYLQCWCFFPGFYSATRKIYAFSTPSTFCTYNAHDIRPLMLYFPQSKLIKNKKYILMMFCTQVSADAQSEATPIIIKFHLHWSNVEGERFINLWMTYDWFWLKTIVNKSSNDFNGRQDKSI